MAYTETTTRSYGSRVGSSFRGIGAGFMLFLAGTALLWWNEGRAVKTDKILNEAEGVTVELEDISRVDPEFDGKLVCAQGFATTNDSLIDSEFGVGAKAIKLARKVEYYQWVEESHSESRDKLGGGEETVTTYTYRMQWTGSPVQSAQFHDPAYQAKNYVLMTAEDAQQQAQTVTFGAYTLNESQVNSIWGDVPVDLQIDDQLLKSWNKNSQTVYERYNGKKVIAHAAPQVVAQNDSVVADSVVFEENASNRKDYDYVHVAGNMIYYGTSTASPQVGDVRITFTKVMPADVTIIAKAKGNTFTKFKAKNGKTFSTLVMGKRDAAEIYESEHEANNAFLWIFRIVGILMVISGLKGVFAFLETLLKVVPFVANIIGWGVGVVCTVIGVVWSLIIIAIAWLFYRPILGIALLALAGFLVWVFAFKGKDKLKELAAKRGPAVQPATPENV